MDLIGALRAFVRVTETGAFSAVAREANASQSAVTRRIAQLERHVQVRLFHRATRHLSPTDDGDALQRLAQHLLDATDEMEAALGRQSGEPRGLVRLGTSVAGGLFRSTRLPVLLARHPGLSVELIMSDRDPDMIEERLDLAFRSGAIADVSLVARRVGVPGRAVVAAPIYREQQGAPDRPEDLADHACLTHDATPDPNVWRFTGCDGPVSVRVSGAFLANDSKAARRAARAGHGVALLPEIHLIDDLRAGRLFRLLEDYPSQRVPMHIVYPSRRNLALRTRVVMDFLIEQMRQIVVLLEQGAEVLT